MNNSTQCPPVFALWHKRHSLSAARSSQRHGLRLSTRINRTPSINDILDSLWRTQPNEIRRRTLCPKNVAVLLLPFRESPWEFLFEMDECVVYNWRAGDKRRHVFATGVPQKDVIEQESEEEETCPEEHWMVLGRIDYRGHFFL